MAESLSIEQFVETAVARVLEDHLPSLREDLIRGVVAQLLPEIAKSRELPAPAASADTGTPADLLSAISAIHTGTTQKEILRALLDGTTRYCGRGALFVIKSGMATGWQGRGFDNSEAIKDFSLDLRSGVASQAMQTRTVCSGTAGDVDPRFITHFRAPSDGQVMFLPLLLKDKIAALVYADAGVNPGGRLDVAALELVVAATSAWLEVISLRKHAHKDGGADFVEKPEPGPKGSAANSAASDPFAAHSPAHASAAGPQSSVSMSAVDEAVAEVAAEPAAMAMAASASDSSSSVAAGKTGPGLSTQDQDTHRKAQRFARLLIDEIKLYNKDIVLEGRKSSDLYDRLKEDIEKSRATYQKRYGHSAAADADYFSQELVRSLAEDNVALLGVNYPH
ncbi:MAG: hypothetical protein ACRD2U_10080 [Terriglobales bacterium]